MPHTKTPGGQAMSDKALKKDAAAKGVGADNAHGHTEHRGPGEAPVASDSYNSTVGTDAGTNQPGEHGNLGQKVGGNPESNVNQGNQK